MSPSSLLASKTVGFWKMKVAVPLAPSLLRVSLTSGMLGSSTPRMNSSAVLAMHTWRACLAMRGAGRAVLKAAACRGAAGRARSSSGHKDGP